MSFQKKLGKIQTTNPLASILNSFDSERMPEEMDALDVLGRIRLFGYEDRYEEKEIPELIYDILKRESAPLTRLVKRSYVEDGGWLVRVECKEGEYLEDRGHEIYSSSESGELLPALVEQENVAMHFIKIRVPKIFVKTLSLPMIAGNH